MFVKLFPTYVNWESANESDYCVFVGLRTAKCVGKDVNSAWLQYKQPLARLANGLITVHSALVWACFQMQQAFIALRVKTGPARDRWSLCSVEHKRLCLLLPFIFVHIYFSVYAV